MSARVTVGGSTVLRGARHCYRSYTAALRASRTATTRPDVLTLEHAGETVYLAAGDCWIGRDGERGQHLYGRRGAYVTLIEAELELSRVQS